MWLVTLSAKLSPEWRLNPGFGTQKECPFPLNCGVPSLEVIDTKTIYVDVVLEPNVVSPEWRCPLNRGVSKERFH